MQTKSKIQVLAELLEAKERFFSSLKQLTEQYVVKDNVFCCGVDGVVEEPDHGYFGQVQEFKNLDDAMNDFNILQQGIRIKENRVFVGNLYKDIASVTESIFIDLNTLTLVNNQ